MASAALRGAGTFSLRRHYLSRCGVGFLLRLRKIKSTMEQRDRFTASLTDEGRHRLLIDAITDYAIYMLDPDGRVVSWNPGAQRFKGYQPAEIIGEHFSRFYTEEDRQSGLPQRALATADREGKFECEGWRVRKDGSRFWAYVVIDPIRTAAGELVGFAKITRDLTDRKAAEEALLRSEQQFRLLVQGVTDYAIYMLDTEGRVTNWNLGAQRIKGYLPDEIIGEHFSRFYTEEDLTKGEPQKALDTAAREGRFGYEGWRVRKDGSRFWANVVIDAIRDRSGTLIGFTKITRDVTPQREAQLALERTREALVQSQKMEAVGRLTGGIAHDFNNLLMAVLGSIELVRKRLPEDPKITPLLDNAIKGAQRGASLTQRMLAFARRQELRLEAVDVPTLVRGMTDLLQRSLGPSVAVETRFPLALDPVRADGNQLELVLLNLAVNARDAMPEGGAIVIAAREEDVALDHGSQLKPGRYICLSVTDTGEGMDETTLARAAEPFFTTKGVGKGTGLGLSMVHGLTEQSGGRLVLKSRQGEGTTAELWLPVAMVSSEATGRDAKSATQPVEARALTVLAVDDDSLVLMNTAAMLEDLGHTVFEAISGKEALSILRSGQAVDLVVTDQAMPYMTGAQLAEAIRAEWPDLPIIVATGYAELPPGADAGLPRLTKPFSQLELANAITTLMQTHDAGGRVLQFRTR
jgi:PAS domain S-box-containing protein